jgi:hypothetical protein
LAVEINAKTRDGSIEGGLDGRETGTQFFVGVGPEFSEA